MKVHKLNNHQEFKSYQTNKKKLGIFMNVEELKKGLNKSLIIECVSMIVVPIILGILYAIFTIIFESIGFSEVALGIINFLLIAIIFIVCIFLLILKISFTTKAMNNCIEYFNQENDEKFKKNVTTAKSIYIAAIILGFIASRFTLLNLLVFGFYIYNLIMWFIIKDRLNTSIQSQNNQENKTTENNNIELDKQS